MASQFLWTSKSVDLLLLGLAWGAQSKVEELTMQETVAL